MKRILIAEDEESLRQLLAQALERRGYEVQTAPDGAAALKLFKERPADLVITDILMPEVEGLETIVALRKQRPNLKIIAISGGGYFAGGDYLPVAEALGANRTLAKPFTIQELEEAVKSLLS